VPFGTNPVLEARLLRDLVELVDHVGEDLRRGGLGGQLVGRREQEALDRLADGLLVVAGEPVRGDAERDRVLGRGLELLDREAGRLGQQRERLLGGAALRDRHLADDLVPEVEEHGQGVRGTHLLAHGVEPRLDVPAPRVLLRSLDERRRALDDPGAVEGVADVGDRLALLDLDLHLTRAAGRVVRSGEVPLDPVHAVPGARAEPGQQQQDQEQSEDGTPAPPPLLGPRAPRALAAPVAADRAPATGVLFPGQLELVDHPVRLRCLSNQLCRISVAATWSTTAR
jgi:hypothetical protein